MVCPRYRARAALTLRSNHANLLKRSNTIQPFISASAQNHPAVSGDAQATPSFCGRLMFDVRGVRFVFWRLFGVYLAFIWRLFVVYLAFMAPRRVAPASGWGHHSYQRSSNIREEPLPHDVPFTFVTHT
eukprot:8566535-Pyramimonas_sp.AAC.1